MTVRGRLAASLRTLAGNVEALLGDLETARELREIAGRLERGGER